MVSAEPLPTDTCSEVTLAISSAKYPFKSAVKSTDSSPVKFPEPSLARFQDRPIIKFRRLSAVKFRVRYLSKPPETTTIRRLVRPTDKSQIWSRVKFPDTPAVKLPIKALQTSPTKLIEPVPINFLIKPEPLLDQLRATQAIITQNTSLQCALHATGLFYTFQQTHSTKSQKSSKHGCLQTEDLMICVTEYSL